jgi:uncharacterized protein YcaQ
VAERISAPVARRIALAAQGFADRRPTGRIDRRHGRRLFDHIGLVQIDSVNVLVRSQELPVFARLGPHRRDLLPLMAADGELFEYWGHEASLLPVERHPLLRFKMDDAKRGVGIWRGVRRLALEHADYVATVLDEVRDRGPISAGELTDRGTRKRDHWWGWEDGKRALEYLFWTGLVAARRRTSFEREYDVPERVIPPAVLAAPTPSPHESRRELLALAAHALGVATAADLCDYFRLNVPLSRPALDELVEDGRLVPVDVEGWGKLAYLAADARVPRRITARTVLTPFDSLIWYRERTERLFNFHYRIEIYMPAPRRKYGYYVLPFLLGDELVARVDLKSDRRASTLLVQGAFAEPGVPEDAVAGELADELREMAAWLGLEHVSVRRRGDLAHVLARAVGSRVYAAGIASDTS